MSDAPVLVLIDDDLADMSAVIALLENQGCEVRPREPDEVSVDDLKCADVVLVDWALKSWRIRLDETRPPGTRPQDGLALAEVLRSHLNAEHAGRPTAFALHSGALRELGRGLPQSIQEHALARIHNLEWVFAKSATPRVVDRFVAMAEALRSLPHPWPIGADDGKKELLRILALEPANALEWEAVADCHPPLHEFATNSNGLTVLRWLAQRVLPYPCFLLSDLYLATRLGLTLEALSTEMGRSGPLAQRLDACRYRGMLSDFIGRRWWRTRIDDMLWEITGGGDASPRRVRDAIAALAPEAELLDIANPVVCLNADYATTDVADADGALRIILDDWPPYALDAWTKIELAVNDDGLRARVLPEDRDRMPAA